VEEVATLGTLIVEDGLQHPSYRDRIEARIEPPHAVCRFSARAHLGRERAVVPAGWVEQAIGHHLAEVVPHKICRIVKPLHALHLSGLYEFGEVEASMPWVFLAEPLDLDLPNLFD